MKSILFSRWFRLVAIAGVLVAVTSPVGASTGNPRAPLSAEGDYIVTFDQPVTAAVAFDTVKAAKGDALVLRSDAGNGMVVEINGEMLSGDRRGDFAAEYEDQLEATYVDLLAETGDALANVESRPIPEGASKAEQLELTEGGVAAQRASLVALQGTLQDASKMGQASVTSVLVRMTPESRAALSEMPNVSSVVVKTTESMSLIEADPEQPIRSLNSSAADGDCDFWWPNAGDVSTKASAAAPGERYVLHHFSWTVWREGEIDDHCDARSTYEHETHYTTGGGTYLTQDWTARSSNMPSWYHDTTDNDQWTIGTYQLDEVEGGTAYSTYIRTEPGTQNSGDRGKVQGQLGHHLPGCYNIWCVFGDATSRMICAWDHGAIPTKTYWTATYPASC